MTNWCHNRLVVEGGSVELADFKTRIAGPERPDPITSEHIAGLILEMMSAHRRLTLTPMAVKERARRLAASGLTESALPLERMIAHLEVRQLTAEARAQLGLRQIDEECWTPINFHKILPVPEAHCIAGNIASWAIDGWGAYMLDANEISVEEDQVGRLIYSFNTPWTPPIGIATALIEQHPGLAISLLYAEFGNDLAGAIWSAGHRRHDFFHGRVSAFWQPDGEDSRVLPNDVHEAVYRRVVLPDRGTSRMS